MWFERRKLLDHLGAANTPSPGQHAQNPGRAACSAALLPLHRWVPDSWLKPFVGLRDVGLHEPGGLLWFGESDYVLLGTRYMSVVMVAPKKSHGSHGSGLQACLCTSLEV